MAPKRRAVEAELDNAATESAPAFPTLKARMKHVSQEVVSSRWTTLPEAAQQQVRALFDTVERPVVMSQGDSRKQSEAQQALDPVLRTLRRKLPRMAFPPNSNETHFNYEHLLNSNRGLEAQLTPVQHSIGLLRAEIQKERRLLQVDEERLDDLDNEMGDDERLRQRRARDTHPLLRPPGQAGDEDEAAGIDSLAGVKPHRESQLHADDETLAPVLMQLQNHVDSLEGNLRPVQGLGEALRRTRAALDDALYQHLPPVDYARVLSDED